MAIQISEEDSNIKIVSGAEIRYIPKSQIKAVRVVDGNMIKLDTGECCAGCNQFAFDEVTSPVAATPAQLRDLIADMIEVPIVPDHVLAITEIQINHWDTAYSWGNHAGAGYYVDAGKTAGGIFLANAAGKLTQDASLLSWDSINHSLGVGLSSSISARLHVRGLSSGSGNAMRVENLSLQNLMMLGNNGIHQFNTAFFLRTESGGGTSLTGGEILFSSSVLPATSVSATIGQFRLTGAGDWLHTSDYRNFFIVYGSSFAPSSGNGNGRLMWLTSSINQGVGSSGHYIGFDYDVTELSVQGIHYALLIRKGRSGFGLGATLPSPSWIDIAGSTSGLSQLRLRPGASVASPNDGDIWHETLGSRLKFKKGADTVDFALMKNTASSAAAGGTAIPATAAGFIEQYIPGLGYKLVPFFNPE